MECARYPGRAVTDPSGKARRTSAPVGQTDFALIEQAVQEVLAAFVREGLEQRRLANLEVEAEHEGTESAPPPRQPPYGADLAWRISLVPTSPRPASVAPTSRGPTQEALS